MVEWQKQRRKIKVISLVSKYVSSLSYQIIVCYVKKPRLLQNNFCKTREREKLSWKRLHTYIYFEPCHQNKIAFVDTVNPGQTRDLVTTRCLGYNFFPLCDVMKGRGLRLGTFPTGSNELRSAGCGYSGRFFRSGSLFLLLIPGNKQWTFFSVNKLQID